MNTTATIKLFLAHGDAKSLRTAEIINWTGFAIAAPRTELDELLQRDQLNRSGVYVLSGTDPHSGKPSAYIGEAEVIRDRLKQHKAKEWTTAIVFVSKDENLTKAHVRYLESCLLAEAEKAKRFTLEQNQAGGSKLPESDRADMENFLAHIRILFPVLGSDLLIPVTQPSATMQAGGILICQRKGAEGRGHRTPDGFVVLKGSTAVLRERESAKTWWPATIAMRKQLIADGALVERGEFLEFTRDVAFSSPSAAAALIEGGSANGLIAWKTKDGKTLKELDEKG